MPCPVDGLVQTEYGSSFCADPNGVKNGLYIRWYRNGQVRHQGQWKNGEKHGHWKKWTMKGTKEPEEYYDGGNLIRKWSHFDQASEWAQKKSGNPVAGRVVFSYLTKRDWVEAYFKGGKPHGTWRAR